MNIINYLLQPRATNPNDALKERMLRIIAFIGGTFFGIIMLIDLPNILSSFSGNLWYGIIFSIVGLIYLALTFRRVHLAVRFMLGGMILIIIDPTAAFWSAGTVLLGIIFTFAIQLLLDNRVERVLAVFINLGIYSYLAISSDGITPLSSADYFSTPATALLTVYMAHFIIIAVARLIRQQQQLLDQQALILEQERVDVLRQFLGHSSHDLRTSLSRLSSGLYIAKKKLPPSEQDTLAGVELASQDMERLVLSMLEMAQLRHDAQLDLTTVPLDSVIQAVLATYHDNADEKSQTLQFNSRTTFATVLADMDYLQRALGNILDNAIRYSPSESVITVTTTTQKASVIITIQDKGIGIAEAHLPHIFDSFYRVDKARNQSTGLNGLGLSISKKIIELHHGTIAVKSEVDVGSVFTVTLPMR